MPVQGSLGRVATGAKTPLNDNQWHILTCVLTSSSVTMYVDGVFRNRKNGTTGTIDNDIPMTVGGKINCDQVEITCDYFSGQIDYITISKGGNGNQAPTAAFVSTCALLSCSFDSSASLDGDGSIASYAWTFGDGGASSAANPSHSYASAGSFNVKLTVTDNQGATDSVTRTVTVHEEPGDSQVGFVASAASAANNKNPTVVLPAGASVGDRLVMALSLNNLSRTVSEPTGVTGWTALDTVVADSMSTTVWTKVVESGDPGTAVTVGLSGVAKSTLTLAAYSGVETTPALTFSRATDLTNTTTRSTPGVDAAAGSWVVSYWADKSSSTNAWTPEASVTTRRTACAADGGRICSALADSAAPVPTGTYGDITATTDSPSDMATTWSVVLTPAP